MEVSEFASLREKRAVVTGASGGIGAAIALELAAAGADVLIQYCSNQPGAATAANSIAGLGRRVAVIPCDFRAVELLSPFLEKAWSEWAGVDIWVNNAGVDLLTGSETHLSFLEKLERLFEVDVRATLFFGREAGERMRRAGGGVVLNVGWDQAAHGMEGASGELFATAKNAIMGFTRSLAVSLAPEVRVNCIAPGWIRTAWGQQAGSAWQERVRRETPLRRWGTPTDIARLARFLVSSDADYLTGQVINANGGAVR